MNERINNHDLTITDKQFCILCELHSRKTVIDKQLTVKERCALLTLQRKQMVFKNDCRWTITDKGSNASNRFMQMHEELKTPEQKQIDVVRKKLKNRIVP